MLITSKTTRIEMYDTKVSSLDEGYKMNVKLAKVDKPELLSIKNPGYERLMTMQLTGRYHDRPGYKTKITYTFDPEKRRIFTY